MLRKKLASRIRKDTLLVVIDADLEFLNFMKKVKKNHPDPGSPGCSYFLLQIFDDVPETLHSKWLIITHSFAPDELSTHFKDVYIKISCLVQILINGPGDPEIWEVYKLSKTGPPYVRQVLTWNNSTLAPTAEMDRSNFYGTKIRVATFIGEPYILLNKEYDFAGFFGVIWKELEQHFNFT